MSLAALSVAHLSDAALARLGAVRRKSAAERQAAEEVAALDEIKRKLQTASEVRWLAGEMGAMRVIYSALKKDPTAVIEHLAKTPRHARLFSLWCQSQQLPNPKKVYYQQKAMGAEARESGSRKSEGGAR